MKMLLTSDLHQMIGKWDDLVNLVQVERPRFVLIAGDLLPKDGGHKAQKEFFPKLKGHLKRMKEAASLTVYLYRNDDHHILEPLLDDLEREGLCINLSGSVHREVCSSSESHSLLQGVSVRNAKPARWNCSWSRR